MSILRWYWYTVYVYADDISIAIYIFHCPILSSISSFAGIAKLTVSVTALIGL